MKEGYRMKAVVRGTDTLASFYRKSPMIDPMRPTATTEGKPHRKVGGPP
jgi:hypothetical protein